MEVIYQIPPNPPFSKGGEIVYSKGRELINGLFKKWRERLIDLVGG